MKEIDLITTMLKYKDYPVVLLWAIGNEMEGFAEGDNIAIWSHLQALAVMIKKIDSNHPIMTVTAEIGGNRVEMIHKLLIKIYLISSLFL